MQRRISAVPAESYNNPSKKPRKEDLSQQAPKEHLLILPKTALKQPGITYEDDDDQVMGTGSQRTGLSVYRKDGVVQDQVSELFKQDYTFLPLKHDHTSRPLWVCHDGRIILEAFSMLAPQAQDFLITIAEPVSRPSRMHEYRLTAYSLYAAVAVGMETDTIVEVLERFSKSKVPEEVIRFVKECTTSYGKVKLVLKQNRYFIESNYIDILRRLLKDSVINAAVIPNSGDQAGDILVTHGIDPTRGNQEKSKKGDGFQDDDFGAIITLDKEDEEDEDMLQSRSMGKLETDESDFTSSFEINQSMVEDIKKRCAELDYPLMEEYDFRNDTVNATLDIDLSPKCIIRDYQEKSLAKMFGGGGGRARSGIIVLPTGAGKTLVGITAACTVKKNTLVLCTNALSVEQWATEFRNWSSIKEGQIAKFTADNKAKFAGDAGIVISTYTMIAHSGKRSFETTQMLAFVNSIEWGLLILDEVHVVPANVFRRVLTTVAAHTKLGLTATLLREDDKIEDLNFLIGPKLYEANWMDLAGRGHIAKVEATEIWCPMTGDFYKEYYRMTAPKRRLLCVMNPAKYLACQYLIDWREREGDKIIVFSDNVFALMHYAKSLKKPFIYGDTSHAERQYILGLFRQGHPQFRTIFLSKVGDTSLDLPEATCLIQISSQFGSRRQEAQRMGRILRAKRRHEEGFRSRFYTLVSRDTEEVAFSAKRRRFLIDQGYEFKVIPNILEVIPPASLKTYLYSDTKSQLELLSQLLKEKDEVGNEEMVETTVDDIARELQQQYMDQQKKKINRFAPLTAEERNRREKAKEKEKKRNPLFKAWYKSGG